jgi:hypothetical protein
MNEVLVRRPVFPSDFRTLFRTLARCAVASSFGFASASCSSSPDGSSHLPGTAGGPQSEMMNDASAGAGGSGGLDEPMPPDARVPMMITDAGGPIDAGPALPGPWVELQCDGDMYPLEKTSMPLPADSLAMYTPYFAGEQVGDIPPDLYERVLYGEHCSGAGDKTACLATVDQVIADSTCTAEPCRKVLIATSGDAVTRAEAGAALKMLLGGVDTEVEAAIAALLSDFLVMCWSTVEHEGETIDTYGTRVRAIEGGYEVDTQFNCYGARVQGTASVDANANVVVHVNPGICIGRRPDGLVAADPCTARGELGAYFAENARLEAASVFAFEQLARDLERLHAPRELIVLALRSALEEVGHVRTVGALAERFGGQPSVPEIAPPPAREAFAIALENAVEGCVRETYGALLACYQAQAALDPHVRAAMTQIAEDETRHAELSWRIAAWLEPQLSEREQAAIQLARRAAYVALHGELTASISDDARRLIGLPDEAVSRSLLAQLDSAIGLQA